MEDNSQNAKLLELTAGLVAAYVSNNAIRTTDLPTVIDSVQRALSLTGTIKQEPITHRQSINQRIDIRKSITPDYIICLEDGLRFKSLRRHLKTQFNMTPEQYRSKWSLPGDYPMVAPNYSAVRSKVAKSTGLGKSNRAEKK
ncbi:MucR family transcriptional regulator [Phyllobacterium sp. SB3]|uniref:MucR family transcriptional regulator n=1 Tax=Phyllobacterium sp. SB3 TaxID=3156073 RepID=UPI0032AEE2B2